MSHTQRYVRYFDNTNVLWNEDLKQNVLFATFAQMALNDLLQARGYVMLNDAFDHFRFERTIRGGQAGWLRDPENGEGDGYIHFGVWDKGLVRGKEWISGELDVLPLRFNVDRTTESLARRVRRLREKGKIGCDFSPV